MTLQILNADDFDHQIIKNFQSKSYRDAATADLSACTKVTCTSMPTGITTVPAATNSWMSFAGNAIKKTDTRITTRS